MIIKSEPLLSVLLCALIKYDLHLSWKYINPGADKEEIKAKMLVNKEMMVAAKNELTKLRKEAADDLKN